MIDQKVPVGQPGGTDTLPAEWFLPTVHSVYLQIFSRLLGVPLSAAQRDSLVRPRLLPLLDFLPLLDAAQAIAQPQRGQALGHNLSQAAHGPMGMAVLASQSMAHGMETIARYGLTRNRLFDYVCEKDAHRVFLWVRPRMALGPYEAFIQHMTVFAKFSALRPLATEREWLQGRVLLPGAPHGPGSVAHGVPAALGAAVGPGDVLPMPQCIHGASQLGFEFPRELAESASPLSDPELYRHLCQVGDEELARLKGSVSARVRHLLHAANPEWPSLDQVASELSMSRRTLLRKLEQEQISYQQLLDEARNELACWYLRQTAQPLGRIAETVGFSDQTNFSRSFKRWKGMTPRDYKRQFASLPG